ncbi:amidohydrolase [Halalkalibacter okhensis]|uniref:Peptidase M20 n=1 Tax=Halalkalibacter okhensis TaxID=333138 RepID=A0A0B0IGF5_9BACI|nr:amidohydrolase [Halalkalibacter okhensis]KHF39159.1 peptidase M20 [Halalkalibacter okhensis]
MSVEKTNQVSAELTHPLIKWRRELHQIAEIGWCEYQTTYYLYEQLKDTSFKLYTGEDVVAKEARMGLPKQEVDDLYLNRAKKAGVPEAFLTKLKGGFTGMVAELDTKREGPHFAFRFDIDALPIKEEKGKEHKPASEGFVSKHGEAMHACGHDGHAAIGLGLAHFLDEYKDHLNGRYTIIFQPAEEGSRGAKAVVEKGWLDDVDIFLSGHIGIHDLSVGTVAATTTDILATTKMDVTFDGVSSHAGLKPHEGKNALLAAAACTLELNGITRHGEGATRINVGKIVAGAGRNIVGDHAFMEMETRGSTTEINRYMVKEAIRKIEATALSYDVKQTTDIVGEGISAHSDQEWIEVVKQVSQGSRFVNKVLDEATIGASEDVAYMIERVQQKGGSASFFLYGTPLANGHHHKAFDFDEGVLPAAVNLLMNIIVEKGC